MEFTATESQIKQLAANAVNASLPMGMGFFHFDDKQKFKPTDFDTTEQGLSLDYVQGRMVKLYIRRTGPDTWSMRDALDSEYQSWIKKYPTVRSLLDSAGIK